MGQVLKRAVPHAVLLAYVAAVLFPFVFVVFSLLKGSNVDIATNPFGLPKEWHLENYVEAWVKAKIGVYFFNSVYLSFTSALAGALLAAATAFALSG
ncbi:MAG: hypothetical protein BAA01_12375 [Bacillus thermozeamaize]|uniref:ABC transmembrane type-1 domain-containing protein n=1 Tax=Bacillus thermozeamaize TaxID=230954 RepID=A0A1Y3PSM0_9BACI|nr:MAG: hypothetical protein BAA01_12375 [Bacillus thermozeamaize]